MLDELEYRLELGQSGIRQIDGAEGLNNRIREWLSTPEGTMADKPRWGHPLRPFQFDPPSQVLAVELELSLVRKIRQDVADVTIRGIGVTINEIDRITLIILHELGIFREELNLQEVSRG